MSILWFKSWKYDSHMQWQQTPLPKVMFVLFLYCIAWIWILTTIAGQFLDKDTIFWLEKWDIKSSLHQWLGARLQGLQYISNGRYHSLEQTYNYMYKGDTPCKLIFKSGNVNSTTVPMILTDRSIERAPMTLISTSKDIKWNKNHTFVRRFQWWGHIWLTCM